MDVIVRSNNNPVNDMTAPVSGLIKDLDKVIKKGNKKCNSVFSNCQLFSYSCFKISTLTFSNIIIILCDTYDYFMLFVKQITMKIVEIAL